MLRTLRFGIGCNHRGMSAPVLSGASRTFPYTLLGIDRNSAMSHKDVCVPGSQGWPVGLVASALGTGEWVGGVSLCHPALAKIVSSGLW